MRYNAPFPGEPFEVPGLRDAEKNVFEVFAENKERLVRDAVKNGRCPECGATPKDATWQYLLIRPFEAALVLRCDRGHKWKHGVAGVTAK